MNWTKIFSGILQDAKLAVISRRTALRHGDVLAVWIALLDRACSGGQRGNVKDVDAEEIAAVLGFDSATVETVLIALRDKNIVQPDGMLAGWNARRKLSTPRTRAYRARRLATAVPRESDDTRRQRLQREVIARHKERGQNLAEQP